MCALSVHRSHSRTVVVVPKSLKALSTEMSTKPASNHCRRSMPLLGHSSRNSPRAVRRVRHCPISPYRNRAVYDGAKDFQQKKKMSEK
jgi:hypothetical protein